MNLLRLVAVVAKKELLEGVRDRRALLSLLVFPLVGPLLVSAMLSTLVERATSERPIRLEVAFADRAPGLIAHLEHEGIDVVPAPEDPIAQVRAGRSEVVLVVDEGYADALRTGQLASVELIVDEAREEAAPTIRRVRRTIHAYARTIGALRLLARGVSPEYGQAIAVNDVDLSTPQARGAAFLNFVPMFVLLAAFIGGMHLASDMTAGERERGSLEPLLLAPVPRRALALGKWLAATAFAAVTVCLTLACTAAALGRVPLHRFGMAASLAPRDLALVLATVLPLTPLVAALELFVASFARTVKEAQIYLSILMFAPMLPALYLSIEPHKPSAALMAVPVIGQEALLSALVRGETPAMSLFAAAAAVSLALGVVGMFAVAALFRSERVVFGR